MNPRQPEPPAGGLPRRLLGEAAWQLGLPLAYFAALYFFFPFRQDFFLGVDEGFNLMKGLLVHQGYALYAEIWSD
jgi:hypothetical protein